MVFLILARSTLVGSYSTEAFSEAKLTLACSTPGVSESPFLIVAAHVPLEELEQEIVEKVGAEEEELAYGWATFCRDDKGLYYEGRCIRGHLKDCANQLQGFLKIKALKSKVANKVYVETDKI